MINVRRFRNRFSSSGCVFNDKTFLVFSASHSPFLLIVVPQYPFYCQESDSLSAPNLTPSWIRFHINCLPLTVQLQPLTRASCHYHYAVFWQTIPRCAAHVEHFKEQRSQLVLRWNEQISVGAPAGAPCFPAHEATARLDVSEALKSSRCTGTGAHCEHRQTVALKKLRFVVTFSVVSGKRFAASPQRTGEPGASSSASCCRVEVQCAEEHTMARLLTRLQFIITN